MRVVSVYEGHATIEIPADWHEMPTELLDYLAIRTAEATGGRIAEYYQHGFRPAAAETGFELPQVLIQILETGRMSFTKFVNLPSPDQVEAQSAELLRERSGPFLQELDLEAVSFDVGRKCLLVDSTMELMVEGAATVRSASFLTERGVFVVHCYDYAATMPSSSATFDRIIASVTFDESTAYRPRWSDRWTRRHTAVVVIIVAACIGLIVVALRRDRSQRRDSAAGGPAPPATP